MSPCDQPMAEDKFSLRTYVLIRNTRYASLGLMQYGVYDRINIVFQGKPIEYLNSLRD